MSDALHMYLAPDLHFKFGLNSDMKCDFNLYYDLDPDSNNDLETENCFVPYNDINLCIDFYIYHPPNFDLILDKVLDLGIDLDLNLDFDYSLNLFLEYDP